MICTNCQIETKNPKFCSSRCSTIHNNKNKPKRKLKTILCKSCQKPIDRKNATDRKTYCELCKPSINDSKSIQDVIQNKKHARSTYNTIRHRARKLTADQDKVCAVCGYNKHVEVCHIKSISSFPVDTLVSVVNHPSNLVLLCPNHHWEFDHNILTLNVLYDINGKAIYF